MNFRFLKYGPLVGALILFSACDSEDELPDEPVINSVEFNEDTKELAINFTDGDGNFGLADRDTLPPYQALEDTVNNIPNPFHNNLWLDVFSKRQGVYDLLEPPNPFDFRIPILTPQGQNKQLRVTATYDLGADLSDLTIVLDNLDFGDTLLFKVTMVDQDLNVSNTFESGGHVLRP
jgi:hypothetical protein